jgi:hypothetical protein
MMYDYYSRQTIRDSIYWARLKIIKKLNFDYDKTAKRYSYYMEAYLGRIYT